MDMHTSKGSNARKHSPLSLALAAQIRAEMGVAKLSVRELAKKSGIPERTLARLVSGERSIDVVQLDGMSRALGIPMGKLLEDANARVKAGLVVESDGAQASGA